MERYFKKVVFYDDEIYIEKHDHSMNIHPSSSVGALNNIFRLRLLQWGYVRRSGRKGSRK
jgi:hypothetical protein